ncbi:hypothetical protein [Nocardioides sp.]|uniref:divisome protein SepX/GlpR n=1 Tax=Nocardioides sp. TaxID=35761 RepID=UPI002B63CFF2|nr:hypothetical protein [Nocardioides sp.]HVX55801.1 hypothetical protein [Nocardioides sp.]
MDPSALIFVALAVAWAVYLIPKALEHHDESLRSRTISTFSHTMRVLARREATSGRSARLVTGVASAPVAGSAPKAAPGAAPKVRRRRSPAARRRNVLSTLVVANALVAGAAWYGAISWRWQAAPVVLLLAWLVACRLMVRRERSVRRAPLRRPVPVETVGAGDDSGVGVDDAEPLDRAEDDTTDLPAVTGSWDPVDVPLPTYVSKPAAARRSVRTIDLDSTGVWSSGRSAADSALAREADAARRTSREEESPRRATGS